MFFSKKKKEEVQNANDDRIKVDTSTITTMIGADTVLEGKLVTKASVRITGTVIGDVRADGVVVLTKTGKIEGTIEADSIIVAGVVKGNMSIRDKVNVEATGEIYGDIITKKFVIDEESIFQGNCIMNRDGKIIPVPPYVKESEKKDDEDKKEDKAEEKDDDKKDAKEEVDKKEKSEEKADSKDKDAEDAEEKVEEKEESESEDSEKDDDEESKEESKDDESDDNESDESEDDEKDEDDDKIIIADINDVEKPSDIPASDGVSSNKKNKKSFVKKSKSLSVEIENE